MKNAARRSLGADHVDDALGLLSGLAVHGLVRRPADVGKGDGGGGERCGPAKKPTTIHCCLKRLFTAGVDVSERCCMVRIWRGWSNRRPEGKPQRSDSGRRDASLHRGWANRSRRGDEAEGSHVSKHPPSSRRGLPARALEQEVTALLDHDEKMRPLTQPCKGRHLRPASASSAPVPAKKSGAPDRREVSRRFRQRFPTVRRCPGYLGNGSRQWGGVPKIPATVPDGQEVFRRFRQRFPTVGRCPRDSGNGSRRSG